MKVLLDKATAEIEVKKSKFIALAIPCKKIEDVKALVQSTKKEHPSANHVVHAAIIGPKGDIFSFSDDGEPKNTSGRPALEVLKGSNITNIAVLIIRYFGGTLLGTGGLVKAYGDSVKNILTLVKTEELIKKDKFKLVTSYDRYEKDKLILQKYDCSFDYENFTTDVTIEGTLPSNLSEQLKAEIIDKSNARDLISFEDIPL